MHDGAAWILRGARATAWLAAGDGVSPDEIAAGIVGSDAGHRVAIDGVGPQSWAVAAAALASGGDRPRVRLVLPRPGDPRGRGPYARPALEGTGVAVVVGTDPATWLTPGPGPDDTVTWTQGRGSAPVEGIDPGTADRDLRTRLLEAATLVDDMPGMTRETGRADLAADVERAARAWQRGPWPGALGPRRLDLGLRGLRLLVALASMESHASIALTAGVERLRDERLAPLATAAHRAVEAAVSGPIDDAGEH